MSKVAKMFFKKGFQFFLNLFPKKFILYLIKVFLNTLKGSNPFITEISLFELKELTTLSNKKNFLNNYRSKLDLSGNPSSDNIYKILRYINLSSSLKFVLSRNIEGDIAECGCWHGHSLFMLKELVDRYELKKIYLFLIHLRGYLILNKMI